MGGVLLALERVGFLLMLGTWAAPCLRSTCKLSLLLLLITASQCQELDRQPQHVTSTMCSKNTSCDRAFLSSWPSAQSIAKTAATRVKSLARVAAGAAPRSIIDMDWPLLGFLSPKTGSNTQSHFLQQFLALIDQHAVTNPTQPPEYYRHRSSNEQAEVACNVAFLGHISVRALAHELAIASADAATPQHCRRRGWPTVGTVPAA